MLQVFFNFFEMLGIDPVWPTITIILGVATYAMTEKKLMYKIEEKTKEDGNKQYKVYKYR